jgi:hypothetical protein
MKCTALDWNSPVRFRFVRAPVASRRDVPTMWFAERALWNG